MELYERIEDYLKNRLAQEARQAFEAEMAADPALAEEVALHRDMMEATPPKDVLDLRDLMETIYQESKKKKKEVEEPDLSFRRGSGRMRFAIAASLLLVVAAGILWMIREPARPVAKVPPTPADSIQPIAQTPAAPAPATDSPKPIADDVASSPAPPPAADYAAAVRDVYTESPYSPGILMGDDDDDPTENPLQKATEAYAKNKFGEVLRLLDTLPREGRTDALKLRAHAAFRLKLYNTAAADFGELTKSPSYRNDAEWHLLLCHAARLPKTKIAYEALLAKVAAPGHPFEEKALALKKRLARVR